VSGHVDSRGATYWNATEACCDFEGKRPDDVGAIVRLVDERVKRGDVDPKRVYLVGFSNGAFLAERVACDHADKIAAVVAIGGAGPARCTPSSPVALLDVHGRDDDVVPVDGGALGAGLPRLARVPAAKEALATWGRVDGCTVDAPGCRVQQWILPGRHWPQTGRDFGERVWTWLAAQHK
jgi:polyhydroxybutyrate depolymerase